MTHLLTIGFLMGVAEWIALGALILSVAIWGMKDRDKIKKDIEEVRLNYLDRFADLKKDIGESHVKVIDAINELKIDMERNRRGG